MSQPTITINGVAYDAQSGLPIDQPVAAPAPTAFTPYKQPHPSHTVHKSSDKSHTLNRRAVKKSAPAKQSATPTAAAPISKPMIQRSPAITKFAPHPTPIHRPSKTMDIGPISHPLVERAKARQSVVSKPQPQHQPAVATQNIAAAPKPSQIIKQEAIAQALAAPSAKPDKKAAKKLKAAKNHRRTPRVLSVASASLALVLLGGYFTYLNMPSLSVRVAAAQAGVTATYPGYHPDGYSISGPVAYSQGAVSMKFAANGGPQNYTIEQTKKNWDSSAVLENYVTKKVGDSYVQHTERGLTIYTFNSDAAWVNNGIFYTISGDAPLSSDQILHIASSM